MTLGFEISVDFFRIQWVPAYYYLCHDTACQLVLAACAF